MRSYKVLNKQNVSSECVVCGIHNPFSLVSKFYELEDNIIVGVLTPKDIHQSYPGRMHGGMISAVIDETIGRAVQIGAPEVWGVTGELKVRFLKPTPLGVELRCFAKLYVENSRIFKGVGILETSDGQLVASGEATYLKLDIKTIAQNFDSHDWFSEDMDYPRQIVIHNNEALEKLLNKN